MARLPKPLEQKRLSGRTPTTDSGGRPLPEASSVVALPMAPGIPDPPVELKLEGRRFWERSWGIHITWVSPDSDMETVLQAARLVDDIADARESFRATHDVKYGRLIVHLSESLRKCLSDLGFTPVARARLGVAEVKRVSALEELIAKRNG